MTPDQAAFLAKIDGHLEWSRAQLDEMRRMVRDAEALIEAGLSARRYFLAAIEREGATLQ